MRKRQTWLWGLASVALVGAAPAAPSYFSVEQVIQRVREEWTKPGASAQPNAPGWNAYFDAVEADLKGYGSAKSDDEQLKSLGRLYQESVALSRVSWGPAGEIREGLRHWLRPRVRLAWAARHLTDAVKGLPATGDEAAKENRDRWVGFVQNDLGSALQAYEGAATVKERQEGLKKVYAALHALDEGNRSRPWGYSRDLQLALDDLFNRPNLDATADVASLSPALNTNIVESGPIDFKGQRSYVTAGPKVGFGLLPSNDGILFYNIQALTNVTPISGYQQQVASDPKGKRAAKLYQFNATSTDHAQLTITAILRPSGLAVAPSYLHHVGAAVNSNPIQGKGLGRAVASLVGLNQGKITDKVYQASVGKIVQGVADGAAELGQIKAGQAAAQKNAQLANVLVGNDTARVKEVEITGLSLASRAEGATIGGTIRWMGAEEQVGADAPQPASLNTYQGGVTADIHLASILTNLARGYIQSPDAQGIENLLVVTKKLPPGASPTEGIATTRNADYATFLKAAEESAAVNDPKVLALRVKRPGRSPEFAADKDGHLVALVHDFLIEVPAPPSAAKGGLAGPPARIYRITAPDAEFDIEFHVEPMTPSGPLRLAGKIAGFDAGPGAQVFALNESETEATPLPAFTNSLVLSVFGNKLTGQPIDVPLGNINLPGFTLTGVSPLDPSGWIRFNLMPTGAPVAVAPPQVAGNP